MTKCQLSQDRLYSLSVYIEERHDHIDHILTFALSEHLHFTSLDTHIISLDLSFLLTHPSIDALDTYLLIFLYI